MLLAPKVTKSVVTESIAAGPLALVVIVEALVPAEEVLVIPEISKKTGVPAEMLAGLVTV
jgi:ribosomal protein L7Ae-like RNA K-turn-binding protein